ncbi:hypothetical protein RchiOBHm_Chr4g0384911 [Rosa chinensis]|uniref:Uncharacterized protein n=1 Tax=Rosa chinensis TaxID=74649 RepID=A0A2P6QNU1_ROSCH|nr:hypothetical protein RchiOBHm_Chr4g0384911 [Rosa chinensis]
MYSRSEPERKEERKKEGEKEKEKERRRERERRSVQTVDILEKPQVEKNARKVEMKLLPKFGDHRRSWPPREQWRRVNSATRE